MIFMFRSYTIEMEKQNIQRYIKILLPSAYDKKTQKIDLNVFKDAGFKLIQNKELKDKILKATKTFYLEKPMQKIKHKTIEYHSDLYVILLNNLVFKSPKDTNMFPRILLPILSILLILLLYIATIKNILPLYSLRKKIKDFANGNYDVDCQSNKKDEIGILSNEFDKSVKKIKKLRDSRQLFLRNIMHELKTPITKGKLSCEMIEESTYQKTLQNVFRRQEVLLNEFARIEKLSANEIALKKENYLLQDIVDYALDILDHQKTSVTCELTPINIQVDFELFGTAIKNLLDNGINYSDDKHVTIKSNSSQIIISNNAKELEFPLEKYSEPYFLEGKKQKSSRGLGFGLFITINIIKLHNMKIEYNREKNRNVFIIDVKKNR